MTAGDAQRPRLAALWPATALLEQCLVSPTVVSERADSLQAAPQQDGWRSFVANEHHQAVPDVVRALAVSLGKVRDTSLG